MLRLEDMLTLKEDILKIHAVMSGEFDAAIAEMKSLKSEMEAMTEKVNTVKKMNSFIKSAEDEAAKIRADADDYYAKAEIYEQNLKTRIEDFDKRVAEHIDVKNAFETFKNATIEEIEKSKELITQKTSELLNTEKILEQKRLDLAQWEEKIAAREKKLADQIAAFKRV